MTVALDMLALGVVVPVLPPLVREFVGGDTARAAQICGAFGAVWALMQFFFSPLVGALADCFGRRPVILLSNLGQGLDYILMAMAPSLGWLFVGRLISGVTAASISAACAFIADVTPHHGRAKAFGWLGAALSVGFIVGPALGGVLGNDDPRRPFWVAGVLSLLNLAYGAIVLPESLPKAQRAPLSWSRVSPMAPLTLLRCHPAVTRLAVIVLLCNIAQEALPHVSVLYTFTRYGWDARTVGLQLAVVGGLSAIIQAMGVGPLVQKLGEAKTLIVGMAMALLGHIVYGLAPSGLAYMAGVPFVALGGIAAPTQQALMSAYVSPSDQGRLQGAQSSLWGLAGLVGPPLATEAFALAVEGFLGPHMMGAPYYVAAIMVILALYVARPIAKM